MLLVHFQAYAKMNQKWVTAEADTVYLNQVEMKEYFVSKSLGEDLSNTALLMAVAAIPSFYVALYYAGSIREGREYNRISLVGDLFSEGVFPLCAMIMAVGNMQYKKAAQKDPYLKTAIATSWLPYLVTATSIVSFSLLANRILLTDCYHTSGSNEDYGKCEDVPSGMLVGVSTLITIPWMRYQFRNSRLRLEGLEIQPSRELKSFSFKLSF
jgi:hypothetical protein